MITPHELALMESPEAVWTAIVKRDDLLFLVVERRGEHAPIRARITKRQLLRLISQGAEVAAELG
jgi:hypothetical protein